MKRINILIVEDNAVSRDLMRRILEAKGYTILEAADGSAAIQVVGAETVHLALVDLNMEPKGGFDFIEHLKMHAITIPSIIITADRSSDILIRANDLGVARILQKPVDPDRLTHAVQYVLERYIL